MVVNCGLCVLDRCCRRKRQYRDELAHHQEVYCVRLKFEMGLVIHKMHYHTYRISLVPRLLPGMGTRLYRIILLSWVRGYIGSKVTILPVGYKAI